MPPPLDVGSSAIAVCLVIALLFLVVLVGGVLGSVFSRSVLPCLASWVKAVDRSRSRRAAMTKMFGTSTLGCLKRFMMWFVQTSSVCS